MELKHPVLGSASVICKVLAAQAKRDLVSKNKVEAFRGTTSCVDLWHTHTQRKKLKRRSLSHTHTPVLNTRFKRTNCSYAGDPSGLLSGT